ncbi:MAG: homoserine dehydrogenase [Verrucomicrobiota bacterium]|jgi:homoserine dehydrogenase|nr:homoserine dehydrogenase [Verrucomicrobiota bacterium]MDK2963712.1 homoserine dehydrogenase [Verrucomicrobiota bacterium]
MKEVNVGILGFGTVGAGVVEGLLKNGELMAQRTGFFPKIGQIADLDIQTDRGVQVDPSWMTTDALSVIDDPEIDVIVELIGGITIAKEFVLRALNNGKPVVTANKALLAEAGRELFEASVKSGAGLYFEASVGGGIPVLRALRDGLVGNQIKSMYGILNGTCNYILTRMEREGLDFDTVLAEAQKLGYAETPPDLDIDGLDTAHKAVVLASLAYGAPVSMDAFTIEGIRGLSHREIAYADELGYRIKLLAVIRSAAGEVEMRVEPSLVPKNHLLAAVHDSFNAVFVEGDIVGDTLYYGRGAGRLPTASAVIGDVMEAAAGGAGCCNWLLRHDSLAVRGAEDISIRCYLRMSLKDQPDVIAKVAHVLGKNDISIASIIQKEQNAGEQVPVVFLTHKALEKNFAAAMEEIGMLDAVDGKPVRMAIEDFGE